MITGMAKRSGAKRDFMQVAREVVEKAIGERIDGLPLYEEADSRNPHRVEIGSKGGKRGGRARAEKLSSGQRKEIAQKAAKARWAKRKQQETL